MPSWPARHRHRCLPPAGSVAPRPSSSASQREIECSALIDGRFNPDSAAVARDNSLHNRQADSGAFKLRILVQSLKRCEELIGVRHIEAGSVVTHVVNSFAFLVFLAELDAGVGLPCCVLPRISEEVHQDDGYQPSIPMRIES